NASIVEIAMSPIRPRKSRHRAASRGDSRLASRSRSTIRCRISAAALRVNVIARMLAGPTPARRRWTYRPTRARVFPVPAAAARGEERHDTLAAAKRDVGRFAKRPGAPLVRLQALLRAESVNGELERP